MRNTKFYVAFLPFCVLGVSFIVLYQIGFFNSKDDIDIDVNSKNSINPDSQVSNIDHLDNQHSKESDHFTCWIKRVIFKDALSSDNTLFMTIKLEMVSNNKMHNLMDQVKEYFETGFNRIQTDQYWKKIQIEQKKLDDVKRIVQTSENFRDLLNRFYEELDLSLKKANIKPNNYYPTVRIKGLDELKFFPVWNGFRKCILVANAPYLKRDGFETVERIVLELETV